MDRIEALARQIDPDAFEKNFPGRETVRFSVMAQQNAPAYHKYAYDMMHMAQQSGDAVRDAWDRNIEIRREKARAAARIAIGISIVLADRLPQRDDGK